MKKLKKKIGVGVLLAGLVMGGLAFSSGIAAYADSVESVVSESEISCDGDVKGKECSCFQGIENYEIDEEELDKLLLELL